jgi:hypothetical protein
VDKAVFGDSHVLPDGADEFVLGDGAIGPGCKIKQGIEGLRGHDYLFAIPPDLAGRDVNHDRSECVTRHRRFGLNVCINFHQNVPEFGKF